MKDLVEHVLRDEVRESGMKQTWLAERIGINNNLLSYYLVGRRKMPRAIEYKIIQALKHMEEMDLT